MDQLLDRFKTATPVDRALTMAGILTMFWSEPGERPAFCNTAPGFAQGAGKTKMIHVIAAITGGLIRIDFSTHGVDTIEQQLLVDEALDRRIALIDDLIGTISDPRLAEIITAREIMGRPKFGKTRIRTNNITFWATTNDPSFSPDLATRFMINELREPSPSERGTWERDTLAWVNENRADIQDACIALLSGPKHKITVPHSRFAFWEQFVLAISPLADQVITHCKARAHAVNRDVNDADLIMQHLRLVYGPGSESFRAAAGNPFSNGIITVSSAQICSIVCEALQVRWQPNRASRHMNHLVDMGRLPRRLLNLRHSNSGSVWEIDANHFKNGTPSGG